MSELFFSLALLACPVGMGAMMWLMMRGSNNGSQNQSGTAGGEEVTRLRAEVDQLRAAQRESTESGGTPGADPTRPR